jgi:hypothetical protein
MLKFIWSAKRASLLGLLAAVGCLTLAANLSQAEVTNRLEVRNNTGARIDFYINGTVWIQGIPSRGARDCYPSHFGEKGDLMLQAFGADGTLIKQQTQRGRVNNFTWNVP